VSSLRIIRAPPEGLKQLIEVTRTFPVLSRDNTADCQTLAEQCKADIRLSRSAIEDRCERLTWSNHYGVSIQK